MAATLTSTRKMIQHTFDWESLADDRPVGYEVESSKPAASVAIIEAPSKPAKQTRRNSAASISSTIPVSTQSQRRNRCEHVGGAMATVLSKYGLGVDDLLRAIDNLRMARNQTPSTSQP